MRYHPPIHETEIPEMWFNRFVRGMCRTNSWSLGLCGQGESAVWTARRVDQLHARADLYGFADTLEAAPGHRMSRELGYEDEIIYSQLDDARYDRALLRARVNMLESDRPFHGRTAVLMEEEARLSRAAWAQSMDACDQTHSEGILLRTTRQQGPAKDPAEPELPEEAGSST
ncbi:hypothetical protein Tco_0600767 [Tanacetum coccineum]